MTGASGFLGASLCRRLAEQGHAVTGSARRARPPEAPSGVAWLRADLATRDGLDRVAAAAGAADAVAHLAAVRRDHGMAEGALRRVNVESARELLSAARRSRRFLFVSSAAVYGRVGAAPVDETTPTAPRARYGRLKLEAERELARTAAGGAAPLVIARPGLVYGPGDGYGMVSNLARLLSRGRFLRVGSGRARVRPVYVDDVADALAAALTSPLPATPALFVLGGPADVTIAELVAEVSRALGRRAPPAAVPEWSARAAGRVLSALGRVLSPATEPFVTSAKVDLFTLDLRLDSSHARERLGFEPRVRLADGLRPTIAWLRASGAVR